MKKSNNENNRPSFASFTMAVEEVSTSCPIAQGFIRFRMNRNTTAARAILLAPLTLICVLSLSCPKTNGFGVNNLPFRRRNGPEVGSGLSRYSPSSSLSSSLKTQSMLSLSASSSSPSQLTDWVIENLESEDEDSSCDNTGSSGRITSSSTTKAGENDTLPVEGLGIGNFRIFAADAPALSSETREQDLTDEIHSIRLLLGRNGWGTGVHPTTRLCLEWLSQPHVLSGNGGEVVLDYGCGSGILTIAAFHRGAARCIGVDVEAEALVTAERNVELNDVEGRGFSDRFEGLHTREVLPYNIYPGGVDVCVANILIGQLVRPSMVAAIVTNVAPGGLICFSGIRPNEVQSLKQAYGQDVDFGDDSDNNNDDSGLLKRDYAELAASETPGSIESYGFDCGIWARFVGRRRRPKSGADDDDKDLIARMSELAVS